MSTDAFLHDVRAVYQGEVLGEALFSALLAAEAVLERRQYLATMLQLESETKVRLRPFLVRLGIDVSEEESARAEGARLAALYSNRTWPELLDWLRVETARHAELYRSLAATAAVQDRPDLEYMVDHEELLSRSAAEAMTDSTTIARALIDARLAHPLWEASPLAGVRNHSL